MLALQRLRAIVGLHPKWPQPRLFIVFRRPQTSRWPFWMLIAAWVCANMPQVALFALLTWVGEARSFTHQERLSLEVACLLTGQCESNTVDSTSKLPEPAPVPVIPIDLLAKKLDLALEQTSEFLPLAVRLVAPMIDPFSVPDSFRPAPPHEPPRLIANLS
jgi:hypothetical protein